VVRGGYAIFYNDQEDFGLSGYGAEDFPFEINPSFSAANAVTPLTPNNSVGTLENGLLNIGLTPATNNLEDITLLGSQRAGWKDANTQNYNLTIQYQVSPSMTASVAYVGSSTHHLEQSVDSNEVTDLLPPSVNILQYLPYPSFAEGGTWNVSNGDSYYDGLQTKFERQFARGLTFLGDYTYSKCRTDARDYLDNDIGGLRAPYVPGFGIQPDYALCNFDVRNLAHFSGIYQLPVGQGQHFLNKPGVLNALIGGWQTNWILDLQDGMPFTVGCAVTTAAQLGCNALLVPGQNVLAGPHNQAHWMNAAAFADPPDVTTVGQTNFAPLGGAPTQLAAPGYHDLDFSLFKDFKISESKTLEFRTEVFNIFNIENFATPSSTNLIDTSTFGRITSTAGGANARLIQFALKFYF
jgi:hypothetical protein